MKAETISMLVLTIRLPTLVTNTRDMAGRVLHGDAARHVRCSMPTDSDSHFKRKKSQPDTKRGNVSVLAS